MDARWPTSLLWLVIRFKNTFRFSIDSENRSLSFNLGIPSLNCPHTPLCTLCPFFTTLSLITVILALWEYGEYRLYNGVNLLSKYWKLEKSRPVKVIKAWSFLDKSKRWKDDWRVSTKAHLGIRRYLSLFSREDMKSLNLVSEIRQASRGVLPDINKKRAAKSSSSHDLDDIAAGCRLRCV